MRARKRPQRRTTVGPQPPGDPVIQELKTKHDERIYETKSENSIHAVDRPRSLTLYNTRRRQSQRLAKPGRATPGKATLVEYVSVHWSHILFPSAA